MRHGEAGQESAEYTGLLAVVALVVAAATAGGIGGAIADGAERAVCAIVGDGCPQETLSVSTTLQLGKVKTVLSGIEDPVVVGTVA